MKPQNVSIQIFVQIHIYFHLNVLWHSLASVVTILEFPTYRIPKKYWYSIFKDFYWAQIDWMKVKITTTSYITLYEVGIDEEVKMYCSLCHFGLFLQIQATWILPGFPTWNSDSDGCSIAHSRVRGWRIFSELVTYYYYYLRKHTNILGDSARIVPRTTLLYFYTYCRKWKIQYLFLRFHASFFPLC